MKFGKSRKQFSSTQKYIFFFLDELKIIRVKNFDEFVIEQEIVDNVDQIEFFLLIDSCHVFNSSFFLIDIIWKINEEK